MGEEQMRAETKSLSAAGESKRQAARWTDKQLTLLGFGQSA